MFSVLGSKSLLNCPAALSKTAFGKRIILGNCLRRFLRPMSISCRLVPFILKRKCAFRFISTSRFKQNSFTYQFYTIWYLVFHISLPEVFSLILPNLSNPLLKPLLSIKVKTDRDS